MTTATKHKLNKTVSFILFITIVTLAFITAFMIIGGIGHASANTGHTPPVVDDPISLIDQLYQFMRSGRGTAAVGVATMLLVWILRAGLARKIAWFKKPIGGYTLGFGVPTLEYLGIALIADQAISIGLIFNAFGAGFVAAGGWEALRDLLTKMKKPTVPVVTMVLLATALAASPGCSSWTPHVDAAKDDAIDCTKGELAQLEALAPMLLPLLTGDKPDWNMVSVQLQQAGARIGGCVFAHLLDRYMSTPRMATPLGVSDAHQAFATFKVKVSAQSYKTSQGVR